MAERFFFGKNIAKIWCTENWQWSSKIMETHPILVNYKRKHFCKDRKNNNSNKFLEKLVKNCTANLFLLAKALRTLFNAYSFYIKISLSLSCQPKTFCRQIPSCSQLQLLLIFQNWKIDKTSLKKFFFNLFFLLYLIKHYLSLISK